MYTLLYDLISRLLSTDPAAAKEVVLADKPLISEETDLLEPTLLDELICHISSLASVYHKPPTAFVEGRSAGIRKTLPARQGSGEETNTTSNEPTVIPNAESLIGDLLSMDIGSSGPAAAPAAQPVSNVDLLGGGLDVLVIKLFKNICEVNTYFLHINIYIFSLLFISYYYLCLLKFTKNIVLARRWPGYNSPSSSNNRPTRRHLRPDRSTHDVHPPENMLASGR